MRPLALLLLLLTFAAPTSTAHGQPVAPLDDVETLATPAGVLKALPCASGQCNAIALGGKEIAGDFSASLFAAWPSREKPELVLYATHAGGNCCLPDLHVLDVAARPAFELGKLFRDGERHELRIARGEGGVIELTGDAGDASRLGDPLATTFLYDRARKLVRVRPDAGVPDFFAMAGQHPDALMGSAAHRGKLVALWGEAGFADLRHALSVASGMELLAHRFLIGVGCRPHSCGANQGFLAIDLRNGDTLAIAQDTLYRQGKPDAIDFAFRTDIPPRGLHPELRARVEAWLKPTGARLVIERERIRLDNPRHKQDDTTR